MTGVEGGFNTHRYQGFRAVRNMRQPDVDKDNTSDRWPTEDVGALMRELRAQGLAVGDSAGVEQ